MQGWRRVKGKRVVSSSRVEFHFSLMEKLASLSVLPVLILLCPWLMGLFSRWGSYSISGLNHCRHYSRKETAFMPHATIGVIGGSGLYRMEGMTDVEEVAVETPFGNPSDVITVGKVEDVSMAFLPRHGRGHHLSPTEIPVRANIWALKSLGVEWVISVSAVGSLREHIAPRDLIIPDQLFDRPKSRVNTFFEGGIVVHVTFADPFCSTLSKLLLEAAHELGDVKVHEGGTYVCMEGPLFSTRAESNVYRSWGMDLIGMTALMEAKLAREAELSYATIA